MVVSCGWADSTAAVSSASTRASSTGIEGSRSSGWSSIAEGR